MMEQADIFQDVTSKFALKFKKIANVKIKDPIDEHKKEEEPIIMITLLGIEEIVMRNMNEKILCSEKDSKGTLLEYFKTPSSIFNLTFMVTPYFKTYADTLKIIGSIVKLIKDDNMIPVEQYDWLENGQNPIMITPLSGMTIEKQMQIFSLLHIDYRPSLFYQFIVGIDSDKKETFKRVEERKFYAVDKNKKDEKK